MKHIKINTPENNDVHIDAPFGVTYTLCGLETAGDDQLGIEVGIPTNAKVTCRTCIGMVLFCKKIRLTELDIHSR